MVAHYHLDAQCLAAGNHALRRRVKPSPIQTLRIGIVAAVWATPSFLAFAEDRTAPRLHPASIRKSFAA